MATDPARTEITLGNDPRLLPGVAAVVAFSAARAGFAARDQETLATAVLNACRETFALLDGAHSAIGLGIADSPGCIEVTIEHSGEPLPTAGLDSFCAATAEEGAAGISRALLSTAVDRVKYDTHEGRSRMTLIKYRSDARPEG